MAGEQEDDPHTHRFRLEIELGPAYDHSRLALLRWMIGHLLTMRMDCPVPITMRVEPVPPRSPDPPPRMTT